MSLAASKAATAAGGHGTLPASLRRYFSPAGAGGQKIQWNRCGDWYRCQALLRKIAAKHPGSIKPEEIDGLAGNLHQEFTHMSTAAHAKLCGGRDHKGGTQGTAAYLKANPVH
jgi:hypothetical protein